MPVEYKVAPEPVELRCPRCRTFVGHSQQPMEAPLCTDCVRLEAELAPVKEQLTRINARCDMLWERVDRLLLDLKKATERA